MKRQLTVAVACCLLCVSTSAADPAEGPAAGEPIRVSKAQITLLEEIDVPARQTGILERIYVRDGQPVSEGMPLADLDNKDAEIKVERAQIEVDIARQEAESEIRIQSAEAAFEVARAEHQRSLDAVDQVKNAVSKTELDRTQFAKEQAALAIEQAKEDHAKAKLQLKLKQNELAQSQQTLDRHHLKSPTDGIVATVNHNRGEFVEHGTAVFRIVPLGRLKCEGYISASHIDPRMYGRAVRITVQLSPGKTVTLDGMLTYVSPTVDSIKGDVHVAAEFNNPKMQIRPGMKATMEILSTDAVARRIRTLETRTGTTPATSND